MIDVIKKRKRPKYTDVQVVPLARLGLNKSALQVQKDDEATIQAEMREIALTAEKRNDLEVYISEMRTKIQEDGEYGAFVPAAQREVFLIDSQKADDWLYEASDINRTQYEEKL